MSTEWSGVDRPNARFSFYWMDHELETLVQMAQAREPTLRIARMLGRSVKAVRNKASSIGLALTEYDARRRRRRLRGAEGVTVLLEGRVAERGKIRVTVDFDVTALTRDERALLMARLQELEEPRALVVPKAYNRAATDAVRAEVREAMRKERGAPRRQPRESNALSRRAMRRLKREAKLAGWQERHFPRPKASGELAPAVARYLEARRHQRVGTLPAPRKGRFGEDPAGPSG